MAQAYDFAIDKIGLDIMSFSIWNDYVTFLKSVEAIGSYAENQKITAIRKVNTSIRTIHFHSTKLVSDSFLIAFIRCTKEQSLHRC